MDSFHDGTMTEPILPTQPFMHGQGVQPADIPPCPGCGGPLRPWGPWRAAGGQLADCGYCCSFFGVVLLPRVRYAAVDATTGVWHSSVHRLDAEVLADAAELIAWRDATPSLHAFSIHTAFGDSPLAMIGDWCRLALRHHGNVDRPEDLAGDVAFLLAFEEERLALPASSPIPTGSMGEENPDSELAPDHYRLRCGASLVSHLARTHPEACWRALEDQLARNGPSWTPRLDDVRGRDLLAPFFLRSPMPASVSPELGRFVATRFPFRRR